MRDNDFCNSILNCEICDDPISGINVNTYDTWDGTEYEHICYECMDELIREDNKHDKEVRNDY